MIIFYIIRFMLADDPQNIKRTCNHFIQSCLVSKRTLLAWHLLSSMGLKLSVSISIWMLLISKIRNGPVKQDKLPLHLLLELKSNSFYKIRKCGLLNHNEGMIIIQKMVLEKSGGDGIFIFLLFIINVFINGATLNYIKND
ncbi:unnamed protein product [Rhizophagus irregularis]|nr:unnamed protein product [Rhizophagus irregularis]